MPKNIKITREENVVAKVRSAESTISLVLGAIVVIVVGILLFRYFRQTKTSQNGEENLIGELTPTPSEENMKELPSGKLPQKYTVQKGDTLWKISIKFYGYGFNWGDISRENKIKNSNGIEVGQELTIPDVPVRKPLSAETAKSEEKTITGSNYTVSKGDTLWKISVRAYQDGYRWPEIAKANNLSNPSLIHPDNVLTIPR